MTSPDNDIIIYCPHCGAQLRIQADPWGLSWTATVIQKPPKPANNEPLTLHRWIAQSPIKRKFALRLAQGPHYPRGAAETAMLDFMRRHGWVHKMSNGWVVKKKYRKEIWDRK